jgi:hypothetical protein
MNTDEHYVNDLVHMTYLADTLVRHSSIIQHLICAPAMGAGANKNGSL